MLQRFRCLRLIPTRFQRCMHTEPNDQAGGPDDSATYDREFSELKIEDYKSLYKENSSDREKIERVLNEYEFTKYNSMGRVPTTITIDDMKLFLEEGHTPHARDKLIHYLFKREMDKRASKLRTQAKKIEVKSRREVKLKEFAQRGAPRTGLLDENGQIVYGLWHNSLFCRIPENRIKGGSSISRLISASMFGRKLIFDFGFEEYMAKYTARNSVDQVQEAYGMNRFHSSEPMDLWFCNFDKNSFTGQYCANKAITNLFTTSMITVKDDCFTNHFDKSRLVYLSPNAREPLGKIHKSDDIYIIGVYNDKGNQQPISYRKAIKLGIRTKSLPLDSHIVWQGPSKSLCINHVAGVMLEALSNGSDWAAAFEKHIPKRKVKPMEQVVEEEQARRIRLRSRQMQPKFNLRDDFEW